MPEGGIMLGVIVLEAAEVLDALVLESAEATPTQRAVGQVESAAAIGPGLPCIKWHGQLFGPNAHSRALSLQALAQSQTRTALSCDGIVCDVVVAKFEFDGQAPNDVRYRIECLVCGGLLAVAAIAAALGAFANRERGHSALRSLARALGRQAAISTHSTEPSSGKDEP